MADSLDADPRQHTGQLARRILGGNVQHAIMGTEVGRAYTDIVYNRTDTSVYDLNPKPPLMTNSTPFIHARPHISFCLGPHSSFLLMSSNSTGLGCGQSNSSA